MIKSILVPVVGSASDLSVFTSALAVARACKAHLDFLYTGLDAVTIGALLSLEGTSAKLIADLIQRIEREADQRERQAKQLFESFCKTEQLAPAAGPASEPVPSATWFSEIGSEPDRVTEYARTADLLVIGRPEASESVRSETLEAALLKSGRPLLIPTAIPITALPATIVIAWKGTQEAARAVTAAMPLLSMAKQIIIMTVVEGESGSEQEATSRLMTCLRWHGFPVAVRRLEPIEDNPTETLLAAAREEAALLVMGGYGHSRLREWIFGGFTQRVLREAEVPVFIAH
jgi:nucleotide-binding universal stress UspA family protein